MSEYFDHHLVFDDSAYCFHVTTAVIAVTHVECEDAGEEPRPRDAFLFEPAIFILNFQRFSLDVGIFFCFFFCNWRDYGVTKL